MYFAKGYFIYFIDILILTFLLYAKGLTIITFITRM